MDRAVRNVRTKRPCASWTVISTASAVATVEESRSPASVTMNFTWSSKRGPWIPVGPFMMASIHGRWASTLVYTPGCSSVVTSLLQEVVRGSGHFQDIAYAVVLLATLIYAPKGLSALGALFRRKKEA